MLVLHLSSACHGVLVTCGDVHLWAGGEDNWIFCLMYYCMFPNALLSSDLN